MPTCRYHRCRRPFATVPASRRFCSPRCRVAGHRARVHARRLRAARSSRSAGPRRSRSSSSRKSSARLATALRSSGCAARPVTCSACVASVLVRMPQVGVCVRTAPHNSGSYLISRALKYGTRVLGWKAVRAYGDERFGEAGVVYRAAGFKLAPPTKHPTTYRCGPVDGDRVPSDCAIYRRHGSLAVARAAGAELIQLPLRQGWVWRAP